MADVKIPQTRSKLLHTPSGEMPDPEGRHPGTTEEDLEEAFATKKFEDRFPRKIPESQGDIADQAENDIEADLQANIERARQRGRVNRKDS